MKITLLKPNYFEGKVIREGESIETTEQHGRELIKLGYAEQVQYEAKAKAEAEEKAKAEAAAEAEAEAEEKAKAKGK
ncbi:DUF7210 family protein [Pantoea agglomerans]|uniref:DUF7210 family protein n=1 Tax=Enterobacter agglomerans TaxID=549 RepID=UPI001CC0BB67|nr:hypothetical protein [Pantoea agglomerans]